MENKNDEVELKEAYMQIQLDPALKRRVKTVCAKEGRTVKSLITSLLEEYVKESL